MLTRRPHLVALVLALGALVSTASAIVCCPFCGDEKGPTLIGDFRMAGLVLFGHAENNRLDANGDYVTDFVIEKVIKPHDAVKGKKVLTLKRNIPATKSKFVIFCDVVKGGVIDDYRGVEVAAGSDMVKYLEGAVKMKDKTAAERLRYAFDFLNDSEFEVSMDAFREFAKADYKDYQAMAKNLPPDTIAKWLSDPKTPVYRYGLYGSLIGHCGTAEHAKLLHGMIDDALKKKNSSIDGLLAGYLMLQPKEAWADLTKILGDSKIEFGARYACLRTVSFLWEQRPDLVERKDLTAGLVMILDQPEMADFGVDYLRKYKCWDATSQVLELFGKKGYQIPIIKRSIMRFALRSPDARAAAFVQEQRKRDAEWVNGIDELLKQERQQLRFKEGTQNMYRLSLLLLVPILSLPHAGTACSLCNPALKSQDTLGEEMERAKIVVFGRATASTPGAMPGTGTTQFHIDHIIKDDPFLANKKSLLLDRYLPVIAKDPPRFVVFCQVAMNKLDPYMGRTVRSTAVIDYLEKASKERKQGRVHALKFYFQNLDNADELIAADAFHEFARATDQEIDVARRLLSPQKIRALLQNPKANPDHLGLLAFLLGGCGTERDADLLRTFAAKSDQAWLKARDGVLAGYLSLKPKEGWELLHTQLADAKKPFPERYAAICALRFCHGLKLGDHRAGVLRCLETMLPDGEVADMAIEDLRQWKLWDLTNVVLDQYGKKSHAAPITKRTIIRYALSCPMPAAQQFVERMRRENAELVSEVAEGMQFEK